MIMSSHLIMKNIMRLTIKRVVSFVFHRVLVLTKTLGRSKRSMVMIFNHSPYIPASIHNEAMLSGAWTSIAQ